MKLDDIITILNESFRNAHVVDDEPVDRRIIQDWVMLKRNTFIKNYINQKGSYEQNALQFEILTVSEYDTSYALSGNLISLGKNILRSAECPMMIEGRSGVAVQEITPVDVLSKTIGYVPMDRLRWVGSGKVNRDMMFAGYYDGRFYIKSGSEITKPLFKIRVVGIFADPTQVSTYVRTTDDYPINDYSIDYMINMVKKEDFSFLVSTQSDIINNASGQIIQNQ